MSTGSGTGNKDVWVKRNGFADDSVVFDDPVNSSSALLGFNTKQSKNVTDETDGPSQPAIASIPMWKCYAGVAVLFFINLLNYMDRYTIAGVLMDITWTFEINNAMAGLLQTVFIISYMLVAPVFGYLGDRYNRKIIVAVGILIWSGCTFLSSFIQKPEHFSLFLLSRALVGVGEASYATISPTLIGDMFAGPKRTRMLMVFFFATPIGSGLGYIVGSAVAKALGGWQWALRVTPALGILAIILLLLFCPNPPRGASESSSKEDAENKHSYLADLSYVLKNRSFLCVTFAFTFMAFVVGSLTLWGPTYFAYSQIAIGVLDPCQEDKCDYTHINFVFGLITCIGGFVGVGVGSESARRWKLSGCEYADALVCAIGLILGAPLLFAGVLIAQVSLDATWVLIFLADVSLCLTWTLISDMTLSVTEPGRRSTANAVQLLISHLFGDAGSPYLLGLVADSLAASQPDTYMAKYLSYQYAMFITLFACILGGICFLLASLYIVEDKKKVDVFLSGPGSSDLTTTTSSGASKKSLELKQKQVSPCTSEGSDCPLPGVEKATHNGSYDEIDCLLLSESSIV